MVSDIKNSLKIVLVSSIFTLLLLIIVPFSIINNNYKCEISAKNIFISNNLDTLPVEEARLYVRLNIVNTTVSWYLHKMIDAGKAPENIEFWRVNDYINE